MGQNFTYRPSPTALLDVWRDPIFKKLFTDNNPKSKKALQSFLEAIIGKPISEIELQNTELPIENSFDKQSRFDLHCKIDNSEYANIEIQGVNTENNFEKRAEYYCAHLLNHNVQRGHKWHEIPKVYQISVLKFVCEKNSQKELLHYKFRTEEGFTLHDRQNIYFLELPKVENLVQQIMTEKISVESLTDAQKWSIFILYASREEFKSLINEISHSQEGIMCAVTILKNISQDELMWKRQFDELILENDRLTFEHFATERGMKKGMEEGMKQGVKQGMEKGMKQGVKQGMEKGMKQGLEEGMKQGVKKGMEEGMKQGIEKGMKQGLEEGMKQGVKKGIEEGIKQKSIEIAEEGLKMNLTIIQIAKLTGLSEEKILELKQELDTQ